MGDDSDIQFCDNRPVSATWSGASDAPGTGINLF